MFKKYAVISIPFILSLWGVISMLHMDGSQSLKEQDAQYRATIVGKDQAGIENALITAKNGVFILFAHPLMAHTQIFQKQACIPIGADTCGKIG